MRAKRDEYFYNPTPTQWLLFERIKKEIKI
jgi:hypothetical protein